jgi:hypothetical protein
MRTCVVKAPMASAGALKAKTLAYAQLQLEYAEAAFSSVRRYRTQSTICRPCAASIAGNNDMAWRQPSLVALDHRRVGRLEMPREHRGVKQWRR